MLSKDILDHIVNGNSTEARGITGNLLQAKLSELMAQKYDEIAPTVFGETKKEQKKAPVTDKDDDGDEEEINEIKNFNSEVVEKLKSEIKSE